jgi:uncharacterized membrane protein YeaQ/YmgE (transglycosylase-associated protein family)
MNLQMVVTTALVGLIAGWLAGKVIKAGGYGLKWDMSLGLVGSIVGSWIFRALRVAPEAGIAVLVVVAGIGPTAPRDGEAAEPKTTTSFDFCQWLRHRSADFLTFPGAKTLPKTSTDINEFLLEVALVMPTGRQPRRQAIH